MIDQAKRGFLKLAGAAAAMPIVAPVAPMLQGMIPALSEAAMPLAGAAGMAANVAGYPVGEIAMSASYLAFLRFQKGEHARERWLYEWRRNRLRAKHGQEERMPAKLVWSKAKLRQLSRERSGENRPMISAAHKRESARIRAKLKLLGFKGLPWD